MVTLGTIVTEVTIVAIRYTYPSVDQLSYTNNYRQTNRQTNGQRDRHLIQAMALTAIYDKTDRQTERQTDRRADGQTENINQGNQLFMTHPPTLACISTSE